MPWVSIAAIYFVTWFLALLLVLPFGVRSPDRVATGHDAGAPERPFMWWKLLAATVLAGIVTAALWWFINAGIVSFRPY